LTGGHERTDANIRAIVLFTVGLLVVVIVVLFAMDRMFNILAEREEAGPEPAPVAEQRELPPTPRLQVDEAADWKALLDREQKVLNSYGWADAAGAVARIPIERAMELTAKRGLPARSQPEGPGIQ